MLEILISGKQVEQSLLGSLHPFTPEIAEDVEDLQEVESLTIHGAFGSGVMLNLHISFLLIFFLHPSLHSILLDYADHAPQKTVTVLPSLGLNKFHCIQKKHNALDIEVAELVKAELHRVFWNYGLQCAIGFTNVIF